MTIHIQNHQPDLEYAMSTLWTSGIAFLSAVKEARWGPREWLKSEFRFSVAAYNGVADEDFWYKPMGNNVYGARSRQAGLKHK